MPTRPIATALRSSWTTDRITLGCAAPVALLGLLVMAGWILRIPWIVQVLPGLSPMVFNTAAGIVVGAAGLPGFARRSHLTLAAGVIILLLGVLTTIEYMTARDLGIDELLVRDWHEGAVAGRMGLNTAVCFTTLGLAYVIAWTNSRVAGLVALPAGIGLLSVSAASLLGYLTGLEFIYGWGAATRMAVHTAVAFLLLGAGVFATGWRQVKRRRQLWLAAGIAGCVAGLTIVVSLTAMADQAKVATATLRAAAANAGRVLSVHIDELLGALVRLDERSTGACGQACQADVAGYLRDYPDLTRVGWVDVDRGTVWFYRRGPGTPAGIVAEESDVAFAFAREVAASASLTSAPVGAIRFDQGRPLLVVAIRRSATSGLLLATVDPVGLFNGSLEGGDGRFVFGLAIGARDIVGRAASPGTATAEFDTTVLGLPWRFRVSPLVPGRSPLPDLLLLGGILVAGFVGTTVYLWQTSGERLMEIRTLNAALEGRVLDRTQQLGAANAALELTVRQEREALEKLREQDRQMLRMFDAMPQIVWTAEPDGRPTYFNQRWYDYSGLSVARTQDEGWRPVLHPDDLASTTERWAHSVATGAPYEIEQRFKRTSDGAYRWHLGRAVPVRGAGGDIVRWFGTCTDIEDYKRAEAEIRALNDTLEARVQRRTAELAAVNHNLAGTRARLQEVLDAATQISIIATDAAGLIRVFNRGSERMLQYEAREMVDVRTPGILHDPAECQARAEQMSVELGRPIEGFDVFVAYARQRPFDEREWTYIRKDGTTLDVNLVVTAVRNADQAIEGYLGIATDITARKHLERELRLNNEKLAEQTRRAEEANLAKSSFLAAMSHEIRTPMNAILGMADLLWESPLAPDQRQYVEVFRRAGNNLLVLINDILDLSKIEAGRFDLEKVEFQLDKTVDQAIELIAPRAAAKGVALVLHRPPEVPTALIGDPLRLRQILVNLMGNAVKFTEQGEVSLTIRNAGSGVAGEVVFAIADTGIGIAPGQLDQIFQDFAQADSSTTRRFGGTGLGLGISRRLVELMGGHLTATSTLGQGSTFTFDATFAIGTGRSAGMTVQDLGGHRVLVVDDDPTNRLVLRETLLAWGMESRDFGDSSGALDELSQVVAAGRPYALAIVDNQMPGMDGFEVARRIRAIASEIPVVMLASDTQSGDDVRRADAGIAGFAVKPINRQELLRVICEAMQVSIDPDMAARNWAHPGTRRALSILVAEDAPDNRVLVEAYLKGSPHTLTFAEDGRVAVDLFTRARFDLVLMDVQMPVMDGLEATRTIRALERVDGRPPTCILALSANARPEDVEASRAAGCDVHLSKPISKSRLLAAIEEYGADAPEMEPPPDTVVHVTVPEGLEEAAPGYLASRRRDVAEATALLEGDDLTRLRVIAHNMAGSGGSYGFDALSTLGALLEQAVRDGDRDTAARHVAAVADYLDRVRLSSAS